MVKLDFGKAREIRDLFKSGNYTKSELSRMFNVSRQAIGLIIANQVYKDSEYMPPTAGVILNDEERFKARCQIKENGCILWTGTLNKQGYPIFKVGNKTILAHHYSWEKQYGKNFSRIKNTCDNRICVNFLHWVLT